MITRPVQPQLQHQRGKSRKQLLMNQDVSIFLTGTCMLCSDIVVFHGIALAYAAGDRQVAGQNLSSKDWLFCVIGKYDVIGTEIMVGDRGQLVLRQ